mmetsp:Transcript_17390/g.36756  ORF Transcript_17390/g.36756 Transcript_17390/m.36756 type:complete len:278 (+) Transcript_17390:752-1585(+)
MRLLDRCSFHEVRPTVSIWTRQCGRAVFCRGPRDIEHSSGSHALKIANCSLERISARVTNCLQHRSTHGSWQLVSANQPLQRVDHVSTRLAPPAVPATRKRPSCRVRLNWPPAGYKPKGRHALQPSEVEGLCCCCPHCRRLRRQGVCDMGANKLEQLAWHADGKQACSTSLCNLIQRHLFGEAALQQTMQYAIICRATTREKLLRGPEKLVLGQRQLLRHQEEQTRRPFAVKRRELAQRRGAAELRKEHWSGIACAGIDPPAHPPVVGVECLLCALK